MESKNALPRGVVKFCAGVVEHAQSEPYISAVREAAKGVGKGYAKEAAKEKAQLAAAICLSLINQKDWPFERLRAYYTLPMHENTFSKEKARFCRRLALELGFYGTPLSKGENKRERKKKVIGEVTH